MQDYEKLAKEFYCAFFLNFYSLILVDLVINISLILLKQFGFVRL